jgi:hypothetical protein
MLESEELETTSCRSRSSSSEVHALQLFFRLVAISSAHAHFRALEAAGLSFRSALPADWQQHSFCPAAALRGFLPFAGSAPRLFAMLRIRASIRSTTFSPFGRAFAAIGLLLRFCAKLKHLLRKAAASQSAKSSEHLRPPNAPTISETQAMPNPKSIML